MNAAVSLPSDRAAERLLCHQALLGDDARPPVGERLEALLGLRLARFLTAALSRRGYRGRCERLGT